MKMDTVEAKPPKATTYVANGEAFGRAALGHRGSTHKRVAPKYLPVVLERCPKRGRPLKYPDETAEA